MEKGNCFREILLILVSSKSFLFFFMCLHVYVSSDPCTVESVWLLILILKRERLILKLGKSLHHHIRILTKGFLHFLFLTPERILQFSVALCD